MSKEEQAKWEKIIYELKKMTEELKEDNDKAEKGRTENENEF